VTKKMRYIMMTDFAVPMSDNGKVFDIHEYAEVGKLRGNGYGSRRNLKETAKLFLRLPKVLYPPFRSGLLVSFVSSKSTPQGRETT
jgi:hypothetical protein